MTLPALPAGIATVTVTGTLLTPDGSPAKGSVDFVPSVRVLHVDQEVIVIPARFTAQLLAGVLSAFLPAADDVGGNPGGWSFRVTERVRGGSSYDILLLASNGPVQDLSALAPVTSSTGTPVVVGPPGPIALTESPPGSGLFVALLTENPASSGLFEIGA